MNTLQISATVDYGEVVNFSSVRLYGLESNSHSLNGTYTVIDSNEFLALVTACMAINDQYQIVTDSDPYDFLTARFNDSTSQDYIVIAFRTGSYDIRPQLTSNAQYYNNLNINGLNIDPSTQTYFILTNTNCIFDDSLTISNVGSRGDTFLIAKNDADRVLCFDVGTQPVMSSILARLTSIRDNVAVISSYIPSMSSVLSNIYTALSTSNTNLSNIYSRLGSINSTLSAISTICSSMLSELQDTNATLELYIPEIENDLDDISDSLTSFYQSFSTYSTNMIAQAQAANTTLSDINDTMTGIEDLLNGESLKEVTVPGSNSPNLWSLIKSSVSTGISGFGQFFNLIFTILGTFSYNAGQAFSAINQIDLYNPVIYNPTNMVQELISFPYRLIVDGDTTIISSGTNLTLINTTISTGQYRYPVTSIYLDPGQYVLNSNIPSNIGTFRLVSYADNSQKNGYFEVTERTRFNCTVTAYKNVIYNDTYTISLVRSG